MYVIRFYFVTLAITFALVVIFAVLSLTASISASTMSFLFGIMTFFLLWSLLEIFTGKLYADIDISEEKHPKCSYLSMAWIAVFPVLVILSGASAILDYLYAIPGLAVTALVGAACGLILLPVSALTAK